MGQNSKQRQSLLAEFWWTRNMTIGQAAAFISSNGGLLTGATFDKHPDWGVGVQTLRWEWERHMGRPIHIQSGFPAERAISVLAGLRMAFSV